MLDKLLANTNKVIFFLFGVAGVIAFLVAVFGGLFGKPLSPDALDILKLIITASLGVSAGAGLSGAGQTLAQARQVITSLEARVFTLERMVKLNASSNTRTTGSRYQKSEVGSG